MLPLTEYVFNTEAHALPILDSSTEVAQRASYVQNGQCPLDAVADEAASDGAPRSHASDIRASLAWIDRWKP